MQEDRNSDLPGSLLETKFNAIKLTFHNLLSKAAVVAPSEQDMNVGAIRGRKIRQSQILLAIGSLINRCSPARLVRLTFQASGIGWLRIAARSERGRSLTFWLIHSLSGRKAHQAATSTGRPTATKTTSVARAKILFAHSWFPPSKA